MQGIGDGCQQEKEDRREYKDVHVGQTRTRCSGLSTSKARYVLVLCCPVLALQVHGYQFLKESPLVASIVLEHVQQIIKNPERLSTCCLRRRS